MKKLLILTNLIWVVVVSSFVLKSCNTPKDEHRPKEGDIVVNYLDKDFNTLPLETAKLLAQKYKERLRLIQEHEKLDDTRSVWFSLEEIEQFSWIVRYYSEAAKLNIAPKDLGIRIYYGKYPEANVMKTTTAFAKTNPEYAQKHTIFMVPTYKMNGRNEDFDPRANYFGATEDKWKSVKPLFQRDGKDSTKTVPFSLVPYNSNATILNHSRLCPPCDE